MRTSRIAKMLEISAGRSRNIDTMTVQGDVEVFRSNV
jgi:hypothetical protein